MAKVFDRFKDLINPNRKADRLRKEREAARRAEEQQLAMIKAAEETERKRKETPKGK